MSDGLSFVLNEEQLAFKQSVRGLVEDKIAPRAAEIDETDEYPWDIDELLVKNGFAGVSYPEEYGGAGGGAVEMCILVEEISRHSEAWFHPARQTSRAIPVFGRTAIRREGLSFTNGDNRSPTADRRATAKTRLRCEGSAVRDGKRWI